MEVPLMQVEYTGRQIAITPSLRRLAEEGLDRVGKVVGRSCSAHVILTEEKYRHTAEVTVQTKFQTIVGLCESTAMETALRDALAKAEFQAIKHKDKFRTRRASPKMERPRTNPSSPGRETIACRLPRCRSCRTDPPGIEDAAAKAQAAMGGKKHAAGEGPRSLARHGDRRTPRGAL